MRKCRQCGGGADTDAQWCSKECEKAWRWSAIETNPYSGFAFDDEVEVEVTDERR